MNGRSTTEFGFFRSGLSFARHVSGSGWFSAWHFWTNVLISTGGPSGAGAAVGSGGGAAPGGSSPGSSATVSRRLFATPSPSDVRRGWSQVAKSIGSLLVRAWANAAAPSVPCRTSRIASSVSSESRRPGGLVKYRCSVGRVTSSLNGVVADPPLEHQHRGR
jgi:hypothetical protein